MARISGAMACASRGRCSERRKKKKKKGGATTSTKLDYGVREFSADEREAPHSTNKSTIMIIRWGLALTPAPFSFLVFSSFFFFSVFFFKYGLKNRKPV